MNWLDIVIIVVIAITTFLGLKIGLIKAVLSLAGLIVGVILARLFYIPLSEQLTFISQATVAKVVAFAIILIGVMIIAVVLAMVLKWIASVMMLGWVNRIGGAVFGLLAGAMLCGAILALWINFFGAGETINNSILASILSHFPSVFGLLPGEFGSTGSGSPPV
jgi:membrane protein required for colicin V production